MVYFESWWFLHRIWPYVTDMQHHYLTSVVEYLQLYINPIMLGSNSKFYFRPNTTMIQEHRPLCKYQYAHDIETLLHSAGGHREALMLIKLQPNKNM